MAKTTMITLNTGWCDVCLWIAMARAEGISILVVHVYCTCVLSFNLSAGRQRFVDAPYVQCSVLLNL